MASVSVYNKEGKEVEKIDLNDSVFAAPVNEHLVHMAVVLQLANKRQGTQKAKTRSEVRGGGRKPWRQKGTGHARQGSIRAPQWTGGGVVFAPVPRDYSFKMNKKEKAAAMKSVLSSKVNEEKLIVVDSLDMEAPKTKEMKQILSNLKAEKALVVVDGDASNAILSVRNIPTARGVYNNSISVYDVLKYDTVVITKSAVKEQKNANVYIRIETTEDEFLIYTKNPVSKERHKKKNPWFHGLGLQNVTSVVEQYGGCAEYNKKQEEFENMILIPYVSEGEEENEAK